MLAIATVVGLAAFRAHPAPEQELVALLKAWVSIGQPADWRALEQLAGVRWAPLPPTALQTCAPDGGCFARQGVAMIGGRNIALVGSGARTMVMHLYLRNGGAPFGEEALLSALRAASVTPTLARCPVRGGNGSPSWYRLTGPGVSPSVLAVQAASARRANEGLVVSAGAELPALQPNQLVLYSEQCQPGATQAPVSTALPHELLAARLVSMLVPSGGAPLYDWTALSALPTGITWDPAGAKRGDLSYRNDRNPVNITGTVTLAGREFAVLASGSATQVKVIYLDESGMHPRGEHMLGVVYQKGIAVRLTRCGPVYTQSTNNWYALTSGTTRPAQVRQSIRYDGNQVQDAYELRLDGALPARDPRDRDPGVSGCQ
jgi:hypothetical protein